MSTNICTIPYTALKHNHRVVPINLMTNCIRVLLPLMLWCAVGGVGSFQINTVPSNVEFCSTFELGLFTYTQ